MEEVWKNIPGSSYHKASSLGRIMGKYGQIMTGCKINTGYMTVVITKDGVSKRHLVHRLVALAFFGPSDLQVDHINRIRDDNRVENLQYLTKRENKTKDHPRKREITGVRRNKNGVKYRFEFWLNRKYYTKSGFVTEEEASVARKIMIDKLENQLL